MDDLKCCANCFSYFRQGKNVKCKKDYIHSDQIQPWLVCEKWAWDEAGVKELKGSGNLRHPMDLINLKLVKVE
jgi:hypothetical protein